jgi:hypothetical protein
MNYGETYGENREEDGLRHLKQAGSGGLWCGLGRLLSDTWNYLECTCDACLLAYHKAHAKHEEG